MIILGGLVIICPVFFTLFDNFGGVCDNGVLDAVFATLRVFSLHDNALVVGV